MGAAPIARQIYQAIFLEKVAMARCRGSVILRIDRRLLQNVDWPLLGAALFSSA